MRNILLTNTHTRVIFTIETRKCVKKGGENVMPCVNLRGEMAKRKVSIEDISNLLSIHRNSVANKLNGESSFSIEQSMMIQETFFPDLELKYLFKKEKR